MLAALEGLEDRQVKSALSSAALSLAPDPAVSLEQPSEFSPELRGKILTELRKELHIADGDTSPKAVSKIFNRLAELLSTNVQDPTKRSEIRTRLGSRGALPSHDYEMRISSAAESLIERMRVKKRDIFVTMRSPGAVEHLMPLRVESGGYPAVSLFTRTFRAGTRQSHILLVQAVRIGDVQQVMAAWRIFPNDVDISSEPETILRAFVAKYGARFRFSGQQWTDFCLGEVFPVTDSPPPADAMQFHSGGVWFELEHPEKKFLVTRNVVRETPFQVFDVVIAYTIDVELYFPELRKRGFEVQIPDPDSITRTSTFHYWKS